jgi:hypothetical protein
MKRAALAKQALIFKRVPALLPWWWAVCSAAPKAHEAAGDSGSSSPGSLAAGVTDKLWEIADIVALIEAKEAEKPVVRGPYRKREKTALA